MKGRLGAVRGKALKTNKQTKNNLAEKIGSILIKFTNNTELRGVENP